MCKNVINRIVLFSLCLVTLNHCSGSASGGGGGGGDDSREMEGSLAPASLPAPALTKGGVKNQSVDSCSDVSICCYGYAGDNVVAAVNSDCSFSLSLPINNYCFCGAFTGTDSDNDGCPDEYLASIGCSENGFAGAIPIFADADGSTDAISVGESNLEGTNLIPAADPCSQVDQDGDGTADSDDTDDDGDNTSDVDDQLTTTGCEGADEIDSDGNSIPDIFESLWGDFEDSDSDEIPSFCDTDETDCEADELDTDGDCIPDEFELCLLDEDEDGLGFCYDCDDSDAESGVECYSENYCSIDFDADGFDLCSDCDDSDPDSGSECFGEDFCESIDEDGDGFNYCYDCDDTDSSLGAECYSQDYCSAYDEDGDGYDICFDCDDTDSSVGSECYEHDYCSAYDDDGDGYNICDDCDDTSAASTTECYQ